MVLPERIYRAARDGDRDTVIAYLNAPAEAGGTRDVNEQSATGGTILMAAVCQIDSAARLAFVWELVGRGADLCSIIDHDYRDMSWLGMWVSSVDVFELAVAGAAKGESCPELFRDFVFQWIKRERGNLMGDSVRYYVPPRGKTPRLSSVYEIFVRGRSSRPVAEVVFALVHAGACVHDPDSLSSVESRNSALAQDEHWLACKRLILGVYAVDGELRDYYRIPRLPVLRLRSLMLRGRAKPRRTRAADPIVVRTFKLPNELVWKVLAFWRVEGEVL